MSALKKSPSSDVGLPPLLAKCDTYSVEPPSPAHLIRRCMENAAVPAHPGTYSKSRFERMIDTSGLMDDPKCAAKVNAMIARLHKKEYDWDEFLAAVDPDHIFDDDPTSAAAPPQPQLQPTDKA